MYEFFQAVLSMVCMLNERPRSCCANPAVAATISSVMNPPTATQGIVPIQAASRPLSKAPNSFDAQIKIQFAEAIRPRR